MAVRMGILALLAEEPAHGYRLKAAFEERTGRVWTLNVGQVYTTLDRLHAERLVEPLEVAGGARSSSAGGRDRHVWRITAAGKAELEDWFDDATFSTTPPRDELLVKVLLALGRSRGEALAIIDRQRIELYRVAQAQRRARSRSRTSGDGGGAAPPDALHDLAAELMDEAIAARQEADLRWLDHCETAILSMPTGERRNQ